MMSFSASERGRDGPRTIGGRFGCRRRTGGKRWLLWYPLQFMQACAEPLDTRLTPIIAVVIAAVMRIFLPWIANIGFLPLPGCSRPPCEAFALFVGRGGEGFGSTGKEKKGGISKKKGRGSGPHGTYVKKILGPGGFSAGPRRSIF
jgi:hypothetical protein